MTKLYVTAGLEWHQTNITELTCQSMFQYKADMIVSNKDVFAEKSDIA